MASPATVAVASAPMAASPAVPTLLMVVVRLPIRVLVWLIAVVRLLSTLPAILMLNSNVLFCAIPPPPRYSAR